MEWLSDPEELPYLRDALNGDLPDERRLAYADLLATRDPERAEWLRLDVALRARAAEDPAVRARHAELSRRVGHDFRHLMVRGTILNCGEARGSAPRVRFSFVCDERWEALAPTEDPAVRSCGRCRENVYFETRAADAARRARDGQCIAVPRRLAETASGMDARFMVGRPDPVGDWARQIFPKDE